MKIEMNARMCVFAAFATLLALYGVALSAAAVGMYHDDGLYLVTAEALASGEGYRIGSLPVDIPQTKYPILFPFVLSLLWRLVPRFPENALLLKLVPALATLVWAHFAYKVARDEMPPYPALVVAWLTLASPWVWFLSTSLMSETMFAAFCWWGLLLIRRMEDDPRRETMVALVLAGVVAGCAVLTRSIGISIIAAGTGSFLLRARIRAAVIFCASASTVAAPWFLWARTVAKQIPAEAGYYSYDNYMGWNILWNFEWTEKATVFFGNSIRTVLAPGLVMGMFPAWWLPIAAVVGLVATVGFFVRLRAGIKVLEVFYVCYVGLVVMWAWPPTRFLVPLYPLTLLFCRSGALWLATNLRVPEIPRHRIGIATTAMACLISLHASANASIQAARYGLAWPVSKCAEDWSEFETVVAWVRENTAEDAVLIGNLDPLLYLYTDRKSDRAFVTKPVTLFYDARPGREPLGPPSALVERILVANGDYLVITPSRCLSELPLLMDQVYSVIETYPGALEKLVLPHAGQSDIYRINLELLRSART